MLNIGQQEPQNHNQPFCSRSLHASRNGDVKWQVRYASVDHSGLSNRQRRYNQGRPLSWGIRNKLSQAVQLTNLFWRCKVQSIENCVMLARKIESFFSSLWMNYGIHSHSLSWHIPPWNKILNGTSEKITRSWSQIPRTLLPRYGSLRSLENRTPIGI